MIFKRIMSVVLIMVMLCSFTAFADEAANVEQANKAATGFTDIAPDAPYAAAVKKLVDFGIISGYPDGSFKPYGEVTRAEMCKMINLTLGYTDASGAAGFPDVTSDKWYYQYALAAQKVGYVKGYEDNSFRGSNNITRQEVCAILDRLLKPMNLGIPVVITDEVAGWARPHVELIIQNFIMPLEANNTFRATQNLKRHELATVLSNMAIGPVKALDANVRFFVNGEQYDETQKVMIGNCATVPADPASLGEAYVFDGWRRVGTKDVVDVNSYIVTTDVDYEAVFLNKTYEVEFYNNESLYAAQTVEHGKCVNAPENPELSGYNFVGWSTEKGGKAEKISSKQVTEPLKLYAVFEEADSEIISVNFFANGDLYNAQTLKNGSSPEVPKKPSVNGKEFLGWAVENNGAIINPESMKVTDSVTLYAVFSEVDEKKEYTVKFLVDGYAVETQRISEGENPMLPVSPEKEGYVFAGWSRTKDGKLLSVNHYSVIADASLYAVFEKREEGKAYYNVTFLVNDKEYSYQEVEAGSVAKVPISPSLENCVLVGWTDVAGGNVVNLSSYVINKNTDFHAVYEYVKPLRFGVSFMVDETVYKTQTIDANEAPEHVADPVKEGYIFKGWAKSKHGEVIDLTKEKIKYATTYHAIFEEKQDEKYYKVSFYTDSEIYTEIEVEEDGILQLPINPVKKNHEFLGWSKTEGGKPARVEQVISADAKYYAVFRQIMSYTVKFTVDGRTYLRSTVVENGFVNVPLVNPKKENHIFMGWSDTKDGEVIRVSSVSIVEDTEFFAVFENTLKHKVTFVVDNVTYNEQYVLEKEPVLVPSNPSKDGYKFKGWSKSINGDVVNVSSVSITKDTVFYAVFEQKEEKQYFTVTFYVDSKIYLSVEVAEDEKLSLPSDPAKRGYDFIGWSKTEDGKVVTVSATVTADTDYYAVFEEIEKFDVRFIVDGIIKKTQSVVENKTSSAPSDPSKSGYEFLGWSTEEDGDITDVSKYKITEDTDFYAVFEKIPVYYTVVFVADGKKHDSVKVLEGDYPEIPDEPEKDGYVFKGWSASEDGVIVNPEKSEVRMDTTYFAVFEKDKTEEVKIFKVVFWFDREYLTTLEVEDGETFDAPDIPKLEEIETFHGWATFEGASKDDVVDIEDVVVTRHMDFYSVITKNRNSPELMEMLERGYKQLGKIRHGGGLNEQAITILRDCMGYVIDDANNGEYISADYIKVNYNRMVSQLLNIVNYQMSSSQRSNFSNLLTNTRNIDKDVQDFLIDYFDIDMSV